MELRLGGLDAEEITSKVVGKDSHHVWDGLSKRIVNPACKSQSKLRGRMII